MRHVDGERATPSHAQEGTWRPPPAATSRHRRTARRLAVSQRVELVEGEKRDSDGLGGWQPAVSQRELEARGGLPEKRSVVHQAIAALGNKRLGRASPDESAAPPRCFGRSAHLKVQASPWSPAWSAGRANGIGAASAQNARRGVPRLRGANRHRQDVPLYTTAHAGLTATGGARQRWRTTSTWRTAAQARPEREGSW